MKNGYSMCLNKWLFDKSIKDELSLLIAITSLSAQYGYCFATNDYLAKEFETNTTTISRKLKKLEEKGYLQIEYKKKGNIITDRIIYITELHTIIKNDNEPLSKMITTVIKNDKDNNIIIKNNNKKENIKEKSDYFTNQELNNAFIEWLEYKKEKHQSYKEKGLTALINKINKDLKEYSIDDIIDGIHNSIANNYQGLFYKKSNKTNKNTSPVPKWLDMDLSSGEKEEEFDLDEYLRTKGIE